MKLTRLRKAVLSVCLLGASLVIQGQITSRSYTSFQGIYSSNLSYAKGDLVIEAGVTYVSLIATNLGYDPFATPAAWSPISSSSGSSSGPVTVSGDATGSGTGTVPLTLNTVNTTPGTFGSANQIPVCAVNSKGLVTICNNVSTYGVTSLTGDVTSAVGPGAVTTTLATVNASPGTVGSSTAIPVLTLDSKGRVTSVSTASVSSGSSLPGGTGLVAVNGGTAALATQMQVAASLSGYAAFPIRSGTNLLAQYLMVDCGSGAGATCPDTSGNGSNATLGSGSNYPAVNSYGLNFAPGNPYTGTVTPQYLTLPAALNSANLFVVDMTTYPGVQTSGTLGGAQWNGYETILSTASNTSADSYILAARSAGETQEGEFPVGIYNPGTSTFATTTGSDPAGHHVLAVYTGAPNRVWWDGVEQSYPAQNSSAIPAVSSHWTIGGAPGDTGSQNSNAFQGTVGAVLAYDMSLSGSALDAAVKQATAYTFATVNSRPGVTVYAPSPVRAATLLWLGDSIGAGYNAGGTTIQQYLSLTNTYSVINDSVSAVTAQTIAAAFPERALQYISPGETKCVVAVGTNDVSNIGATPAQTWANIVQIGRQCHAAGAQAVVVTMTSRTGQDANKDALNTLERQYWKSSGAFDAIADAGEVVLLGADGASTDTTYFVDGTHLTSAGQQLYAGAVSNAVNYLDGYSDSMIHFVLTATPYTMTIADRYVFANGGQTSITLPLCTGMTGATYSVITSVAGTFSSPSDSAYGIYGSSAYASQGTATFLVNLTNGSTGGGCNYVRTQ